jgi:hypothetical protein
VALVEGESDCHTLWFYGIPALGIPGATNWREDRDAAHLDGIDTIYVVVEPDRGGDALREWLGRSSIRHRAKLVRLPTKDPSALHLEGSGDFLKRWHIACDSAIPWTQAEAESGAAERADAWKLCGRLASKADIFDDLNNTLSVLGLVGERRTAKLVYLAVTSRLLDRPVSIAVKGPSSGGKSFVVESTLRLFPTEAFYALSAMSDRALAYSSEPLQHRHLVIYEAAGMASEFATYLIRTLLSEGRLRYETVEKTKDGLTPRLIEREGPTGLIVTTTSLRLHPENETRMLSLSITDTQNQTAAVFRALARDGGEPEVERSGCCNDRRGRGNGLSKRSSAPPSARGGLGRPLGWHHRPQDGQALLFRGVKGHSYADYGGRRCGLRCTLPVGSRREGSGRPERVVMDGREGLGWET